jgi:hypothetical protein
MARRGGPALYELLDKRDSSKGSQPSGAIPAIPSSARLDPKAVQSLVIAVVVLAAIVTAYMFGVSVGVSRGRSAAEQSASTESGGSPSIASGPSATTPRPSDGSRTPTTPENSATNGLAVPPSGLASNAGNAENSAAASSANAALGPASAGDPRQSGLSYFVLCSTLEANALKVVDFCRSKGLDAYVVPDQNGRLREVTVLPGFEAGERSSPAIKELEERIRKVGVSWKASGPGNSDFGDRYIKTHR